MQSKNSQSGFSLVEILLVVVIMGILAGVVIAHFQPNAIEQLKAAGQILSSEMAYVRNMAVTNNTKYRLTFDNAENRFALEHAGNDSNLDTLPSSPFADSQSAPKKQIIDLDNFPNMGSSVQIYGLVADGAKVTTLEFDALGATTRAEETTIWLKSGEGSAARYLPLLINPITGLTTLGNIQASAP